MAPPRPRLIREILLWSTLVVAGFGAIGLACRSVLSGPCEDDVLSETPSADGKRVARVYVRNCGATTGYVTRVSIQRPRSLLLDEDEVVFSGVHREGPPADRGAIPLKVHWSGPRALAIARHSRDLAVITTARALDVDVRHETF
jgi:hypothetical protein